MAAYPRVPDGWSVVDRQATGPFTTKVTYERPDGRRVTWASRAHRKHASRLSRVRDGRDGMLWAPHRASWWIAVLFSVGSVCFLVGPLPGFVELVGLRADGAVFFVGSVFFTSAAALQWLETINADRDPAAARPSSTHRSLRLFVAEPHRIDWWVSGVQLVGTVFFNVTTFRALSTATGDTTYDRLVWQPDALGSICFLVSGYLAYVEVTGGLTHRPPRGLEPTIVTANFLGCVLFAASAVCGYVLPSTGVEVNVNITNAATSLGALCFLVGSLLLLPEGVRQPAAEQDVSRSRP